VLTHLNLTRNNLGADGAKAIAGALSSGMAVLTSIDVGFNTLDEEAALSIVRAVRRWLALVLLVARLAHQEPKRSLTMSAAAPC